MSDIRPECFDESCVFTLEETCRFSQTTESFVVELIEYGIVEPQGSSKETWVFTETHIIRLKKAYRLNADLDVNVPGIALVLELLEQLPSSPP